MALNVWQKEMNQTQYSSMCNTVIFMLFQKGNQSHSPPQSAKSKFGSNLPFVWNDSGTESWIFYDHEEDQPDRSGSYTVVLRIKALCRLDIYYWTGVVWCLINLCSEWMMNYPFHCSLIMYLCAGTLYRKSELIFALSRAATMGTLSCAYSPFSHRELVLCATSPLCLYDTQ
jgi:hypothetical protein